MNSRERHGGKAHYWFGQVI